MAGLDNHDDIHTKVKDIRTNEPWRPTMDERVEQARERLERVLRQILAELDALAQHPGGSKTADHGTENRTAEARTNDR